MSEKRPAPKPRKKPATGGRKPAAKAAGKPKPRAKPVGNPAYRGAHKRGRIGTMIGRIRARFTRRNVAMFVLRTGVAGALIGGLTLLYFSTTLPDISALETIKKQQGITIETMDGRVIANYGDVYGNYLPYEQLPKSLIAAVIATEDRRFFEHHGVDFWGIARAMVTNAARGHMVQGGSTVTQQVAKNVFLTPERTLKRKLQEVLLAFWLEGRFTKKEIMAIYLNRVYLGSGTFGVDAAARRYFNKSARDLNLYESALMAGLLKAPSRYSPAASPERAKTRVHQVLLNMVDAGYLKQKDVDPAMASYEKSPAHNTEGGDVRYFTDWVVDEIPNYVGEVGDDMVVTTTLNTTMQAEAQEAIQNVLSMQGADKNISQGALVSMTPDGAVQAMVGGVSYAKSQYNRAAQAKRQPGSVFKLFVYLSALEAGMTPMTPVLDAPIEQQVGSKTWAPDNFTADFRGEIPMVEALRNSLNTVSVRLSQYAGIGRVAQMAMRLGIPNVPAYPSIALGAVEATLLEMTGAYAHLPNGGNKVVPYGILSIRTRGGQEIYKRTAPTPEPVLATGTVQMMNYMLLDVVRRGTAVKAGLPKREVAGKTGTSQDFKDAWFIGFTPQIVTGVWVGNDDNKSMKKVTGGSIPAIIWHDFMIHAMEGKPVQSIPNSPSSGDGLLPWLFGVGNDTVQPSQAESMTPPPANPAPLPAAEQAPAPVVAPQNSPFGYVNPPAPQPVQPKPAPAPVAVPAPATKPAPKPSAEPDVLTPAFWNKLMDENVKIDKTKVQHTYPGQKH